MYSTYEYSNLTRKYGPFSSWAIWDHENALDNNVIGQNITQLHSRYVLLGLNISRSLSGKPWTNFHGNSHDRKIKYACNDTVLRGSYITDIFKGIPEPQSNRFKKALTNQIIDKNVNFFVQEMVDVELSHDSQFIVFGTPGSITASCFDSYFRRYFNNKVTYYYHYAYYAFTDRRWVEGFWKMMGIKQDYDSIVKSYR